MADINLDGGAYPPLYLYNETDQGGLVVVVTYTFLCVSASVAAAQLYMNLGYKKRAFYVSDALLLAANIMLVPQAIVVQYSVNNGLGRHIDTLTSSMLRSYFKLTYSQNLLSIVIQALAKASVAILSGRIDNVGKQMRIWVWVLAGLITIWTLFSVFSVAFMCRSPERYIFENARCRTGRYLWYPITVLNIITDLLLGTVILPVILNLNMAIGLRLSISALFILRLVWVLSRVCFVSIASLILLGGYLETMDKTWYNNTLTAINQIVLHTSCITASLPSLHKFFTELQTGQMGAHLPNDFELVEGSGRRYARSKSKDASSNSDFRTSRKGSGMGSMLKNVKQVGDGPLSPTESREDLITYDDI
ncbi:hypothetical protein EJ05DRAFT_485375 [Pseudovirgaria hyperparasitica]|uniref:Rhodopsin domain-containing protein n=1 Tax=Pseudovirgaria hyperparasitica TaxID=470096 RepID=A0A6A6WCP7_9PEZI|nr:uncharacterized protein EJ05DRAFT_485375 [Pseudovirgaria hyperparasitica]KAF2759347.1 hypothetical protein EJ05DRAFT_485375 [Pseudovirgaria hyperparasitica]